MSNTRSIGHTVFWSTLGATAGWIGWMQTNLLLLLAGGSLLWSGAAFVIGPHLFGKRTNGSLPLSSYAMNGLFLFAGWLGWRIRRWRSDEDFANEISPGVWLGSRPTPAELGSYATVVDLIAELPASPPKAIAYHAFPTMDGTAPTHPQIQAFLATMNTAERPVLIHCLAGHGRSATLMMAWLIAEGSTEAQALAQVQASRPAAGPNRKQLRQLAEAFR